MASLNFKGKSAVWNHHLSVPYHTLEKVESNSLDGENSSENLLIEWDNLLALKALLPKYQGQIDCVYIDPPYNTGEEWWCYNDNVSNPIIKEWIGRIVWKEWEDLIRHDKWLAMMTPRLKLLSELLADSGVIFVSIDENEVHNLINLMNEIFWEENHITNLIWKKRNGWGNDSQFFAVDHEYILVYVNEKKKQDKWRVSYDEKYLKRYKEEDDISRFYWDTLSRPGLNNPIIYDVECPDWTVIKNGTWQIAEKTFKLKLISQEVKFERNKNNWWTVFHKIRMPSGKVLRSILSTEDLLFIEGTTNKDAGDSMEELFGKKVFDNPKPSELIRRLISVISGNDWLILDSFAWSGTTAQAVMELNQEDGGNRKFILVQLPETITEKAQAKLAGYDFVHEITLDRIKKVKERDNLDIWMTYYKLGPSIEWRKILEWESLPSWESFAKYVHFLATGKPIDDIADPDATWEICTEDRNTGVYLIYADTIEELRNLAITRDWLESVKSTEGKKIVYAPACFLDKEVLDDNHISFVQVPYNLFQRK
jgi:adenine-specific DNA-methyltransferase